MKADITVKKEIFNPVYLPYLEDRHRFLVFYGGAGSGKSVFIAQRLLYRMLKNPRCNVLVLRQVARTNRDSTFALMRQMIARWKVGALFRVYEGDLRIKCASGAEMIFEGLDDPEKLKSVTFASGELTDVWMEEATEMTEEGFLQLNLRLRGGVSTKQIVLSFNPVNVNHWLKRRFFDRTDRDTAVVHTTYRDNRFLDEAYIAQLEGYRETDPYFYAVYCLGQWGVYGQTVFRALDIQTRLDEAPEPTFVGDFTYDYDGMCIRSFKLTPEDGGALSVWHTPVPGQNYAIGADTAGDGSDAFVAQVVDARGFQCAVLRRTYDEDEFSRQLYCLGRYYNDAVIAVETNFSTHPVRELSRLGYSRQYVREAIDTYTRRPTEQYGFRTDAVSRPVILGELIGFVRDNAFRLSHKVTLNEMLSFVRNEKGRPEAASGAHDDCIMALAIALHAREQMAPDEGEVCSDPRRDWTQDMWEDYEQSDEAGKAYLARKWR